MRLWTPGYLMAAILVTTSPGWAQSATITNTTTDTVTNTVTNTATITPTNPGMNPPMNPAMNPGMNPANLATNPTPDPATAGDFQKLSPGNQKIAQALFAAQRPAAAGPRLTLDQIAALKQSEGWGRAFRQMKADGVIQARNLGHVVSAYEHSIHSAGRSGSPGARAGAVVTTGRGAPMVITNGAGRSTVVTNAPHASAGGRFASGGTRHSGNGGGGRGSANITTAAGSAPSAGGVAHGGGGSEHGGGHGR